MLHTQEGTKLQATISCFLFIGNTLGFYGGLFSATGKEILAHSYNGAFHIWREKDNTNNWLPCVTVGGHFSEVVDCAWEPKGEYLMSAGADQTVRVHAPWLDKDREVRRCNM